MKANANDTGKFSILSANNKNKAGENDDTIENHIIIKHYDCLYHHNVSIMFEET
jgi:hypothetical protein